MNIEKNNIQEQEIKGEFTEDYQILSQLSYQISVGDLIQLTRNYLHLYKSTYDRKAHGAWPIRKPFIKGYKNFTYCCH